MAIPLRAGKGRVGQDTSKNLVPLTSVLSQMGRGRFFYRSLTESAWPEVAEEPVELRDATARTRQTLLWGLTLAN
jgi:hypothetical protein